MYAPTLGIHWNSPENVPAEFFSQEDNSYPSVIDLQVLQWWSHREALLMNLDWGKNSNLWKLFIEKFIIKLSVQGWNLLPHEQSYDKTSNNEVSASNKYIL